MRFNFVSQDKEFLREYHLREMALSDWTTGINTAFEEGMEKGKEITALNALAKGVPVELICEITGLDIDVLRSLQLKV